MRTLIYTSLVVLLAGAPAACAWADSGSGCGCNGHSNTTQGITQADAKQPSHSIGWERLTYEHQQDRDALFDTRKQRRDRLKRAKQDCRRRCSNSQRCPRGCGCGGKSGPNRDQKPGKGISAADAALCHCKPLPKDGPSGTGFLRGSDW